MQRMRLTTQCKQAHCWKRNTAQHSEKAAGSQCKHALCWKHNTAQHSGDVADCAHRQNPHCAVPCCASSRGHAYIATQRLLLPRNSLPRLLFLPGTNRRQKCWWLLVILVILIRPLTPAKQRPSHSTPPPHPHIRTCMHPPTEEDAHHISHMTRQLCVQS